jgi:hypothetical protein
VIRVGQSIRQHSHLPEFNRANRIEQWPGSQGRSRRPQLLRSSTSV